MAITVSGILRDSGGNPAKNDIIKFYTTQGFNGALPSATLEVVTTSTGAYDFELSVGIHLLSVQYNDVLTKVGKVTVTSDMPSPQTLDSLLAFEEPLLPEEIIIAQQLVAEAAEAANNASNSAQAAAQSEQAVEEDRQEVATNTAAVEQNAQAVESARSEVEQNTQTVATNTQTVSDKTAIVVAAQADVTTKAQQVSDDATQVAQDKSDTDASALLAQMWAAGSSPTPSTPSDTNNAYYYAMLALSNANQTFISGGQWDPSDGTEYPDVSGVERDTIWLIVLPIGSSSYVITSGPLSGSEANSGDMLFYDTPNDTWSLISTTIKAPEYVFKSTEFTGIGGETVLQVPAGFIAQAGFVTVNYNGSLLSLGSYSITDNGSTVTLTDSVDDDADIITLTIWNKVEQAVMTTSQILSGTTPPNDTIGKDGDIYYYIEV